MTGYMEAEVERLGGKRFKVKNLVFDGAEELLRYLEGRLNGTHCPYLVDQVVRQVSIVEPTFLVHGWVKFGDDYKKQHVVVTLLPKDSSGGKPS